MRFLAANSLHYSGILWAWRFLRRRILGRPEVCVLVMHRVLTEGETQHSGSHPAIVLRAATFLTLLQHLSKHWHVLSMDGFLQARHTAQDQSRPLCLLTFDDGWKDNYSTALPALRQTGIPATVFITTGYVENTVSPWVERLKHMFSRPEVRDACQTDLGTQDLDAVIEQLKRMPAAQRARLLEKLAPAASEADSQVDQMMTWEQIRQMAEQGIDFGGHTVTHPLLVYEDDATVDREVRGCREILEKRLQRKIRSFAYPNGDWDDRVREAVRRAGFECAFTAESGWHDLRSDPYTIRRINIHERNVTGSDGRFSPAAFNLTVSGWL